MTQEANTEAIQETLTVQVDPSADQQPAGEPAPETEAQQPEQDQAQDLEALKSELEQAKASAKEQEEKLLLIKDGGFYPDEVDTVLKLCHKLMDEGDNLVDVARQLRNGFGLKKPEARMVSCTTGVHTHQGGAYSSDVPEPGFEEGFKNNKPINARTLFR